MKSHAAETVFKQKGLLAKMNSRLESLAKHAQSLTSVGKEFGGPYGLKQVAFAKEVKDTVKYKCYLTKVEVGLLQTLKDKKGTTQSKVAQLNGHMDTLAKEEVSPTDVLRAIYAEAQQVIADASTSG